MVPKGFLFFFLGENDMKVRMMLTAAVLTAAGLLGWMTAPGRLG